MWARAKSVARSALSDILSLACYQNASARDMSGPVRNTAPKSSDCETRHSLWEKRLDRQAKNTPAHIIQRRKNVHAILSKGGCFE